MIKNSVAEPVNLTWERATYEKSSHIQILQQEYSAPLDKWHRHAGYWELVFVLSGKAVNEMEAASVCLSSGDLFVMPPESVHHYVSMHHFKHYVLLFKPDVLEHFPGNFATLPNYRKLFQRETECSKLLHIEGNDMHEAIEKMENAQTEYLNRSAGWLEAVYVESFRALLFLLRHANPIGQYSNPVTCQIGKTIRYMEEHLQENFSLNTLSSVARMSVSNFRLRFREVTGMSPIDYLIRLRLRQAAILIAYTDQPISDAFQQTGFSDGSYFARQFRTVFGKTARQFRKEVQAGTLLPAEELQRILHHVPLAAERPAVSAAGTP